MIDLLNIIIHVTEPAAEAVAEAANASPEAKESVVGLLGINWKLFIAQLINFSIIVLILWRWVFRPVTKTLAERTEKIEKSLRDAEDIKKKVEELQEYKREQVKQARAEYDKIVADGETAGASEKQAILQEANQRAEVMIAEAEKRIGLEQDKMVGEVKRELADMLIAGMEKVAKEKLNPKKDAKLIEDSLKNIV